MGLARAGWLLCLLRRGVVRPGLNARVRWSSEDGQPVKPHRRIGRFSRTHLDSGSPGTLECRVIPRDTRRGILCRRDSGNGDKFFCAPDARRPPPCPTSSLGSRAPRLPQMARRRIGCACTGPSLAPGPAAPAPLRPHARAYACRGLLASCFALPWRAANAGAGYGRTS